MQFLLLLINKKACKLRLKFISKLMWSQAHRKAATNIPCRCCPLHLESHVSPPWSWEIFHIPPEGPHCPCQPHCCAQRDKPGTTLCSAPLPPRATSIQLYRGIFDIPGSVPVCSEQAACGEQRGLAGKFAALLRNLDGRGKFYSRFTHQHDLEQLRALTKPKQGSSKRVSRHLPGSQVLRYIKYKPAQTRTGTFRISLPPHYI